MERMWFFVFLSRGTSVMKVDGQRHLPYFVLPALSKSHMMRSPFLALVNTLLL